jgi:GTP cyclohydrolase IA
MNSPPLGPKPKPAIPTYLMNGGSPLHPTSRARERENLNSSIKSSYGRRTVVDLDDNQETGRGAAPRPWENQQDISRPTLNSEGVSLNGPARDSRDEAPITPPVTASRPASPYTLNPPIDFDGLSWPSEWELRILDVLS